MNELYSNNKNRYLYIWIDILGFSDYVKKGNEEVYERMIDLVNSFRNKFNEMKLKPEILIPISDGIVIVFELKNKNPEHINKIFKTIAKTQLKFILEKQEFLRGGFAVGTICDHKYKKMIKDMPNEERDIQKQTIFLVSNGLIEAYIVESSLISYPIIGSTIKVIRDINEDINFTINNKSDINYFNLQKINGKNGGLLYIIDFLKYIEDAEKEKFKRIICKKIEEFANKENILQKYVWILRYYEKKFNEEGLLCNKYLDGVLL
jgi:hypothetical protein